MFVERTHTALGELMSGRLDDVCLAVMMLDGLDRRAHARLGAARAGSVKAAFATATSGSRSALAGGLPLPPIPGFSDSGLPTYLVRANAFALSQMFGAVSPHLVGPSRPLASRRRPLR